jgi:glycosyltransferase involved in cell wall biosynthesis
MLKKHPRILIIGQTPPPYGGQSINIGKIVSFLESNGIDHKFIRMNFSEEMDETGKFAISKIFKLFQILFKIAGVLISYKPDYVYYPPSGFEKVPVYRDLIILGLVKLFKPKLIFHFHAGGLANIYPTLSPFFQKFFDYAFRNPEYAICMSEAGKRDPVFLGCKTIVLIPYGVDDLVRKEVRQATASKKDFTILFVGVCRESKGILDFLEILKKARLKNNTIIGRVVGKAFGLKEQEALKQASAAGIIKYEGVKIGEEKITIFNESDIFLFPTFFEHENFPTVNLEAFSCGLPVISTNWRGVVDQIENGNNGFRHEIHDIDGMADSAVRIAENRELCQEMSQNARLDYQKFYSIQVFERNIINFFTSLK